MASFPAPRARPAAGPSRPAAEKGAKSLPSNFSYRFSPAPETKAVISVSKKAAKLAVTRNLIKRRVRAVLRDLSLEPGTHLLIARAGAEKVKGAALEKELRELLKV